MIIDLKFGDCLELMKVIPNGSIDAIITDPPYGTTACKWDNVIDFELMWYQLNRIIKPNGAIVLFGSEPFSSALRMSNIKNYRYDWIWNKRKAANFAQSKFQPLKVHEIISVFYNKKSCYYPIKTINPKKRSENPKKTKINKDRRLSGLNLLDNSYSNSYEKDKLLPISICDFSRVSGRYIHPTQKPIKLMEYLIKTYTNENETVLDFTMGSGTTGVACINTNRNFIGIENNKEYFNISLKRVEEKRKEKDFTVVTSFGDEM